MCHIDIILHLHLLVNISQSHITKLTLVWQDNFIMSYQWRPLWSTATPRHYLGLQHHLEGKGRGVTFLDFVYIYSICRWKPLSFVGTELLKNILFVGIKLLKTISFQGTEIPNKRPSETIISHFGGKNSHYPLVTSMDVFYRASFGSNHTLCRQKMGGTIPFGGQNVLKTTPFVDHNMLKSYPLSTKYGQKIPLLTGPMYIAEIRSSSTPLKILSSL